MCTPWAVAAAAAAAAGMVCVTVRPKDDSPDSADASAGSFSRAEGARRLASFQRLLSRARGEADSSSNSSEQQRQLAEGVPLKAEEVSEDAGGQVQMQSLGVASKAHQQQWQQQQQQQQQQGLLSSQQHSQGEVGECGVVQVVVPHHSQPAEQQQQQHEQVVVLLQHPAPGASDHSMHHRHPAGSPGAGAPLSGPGAAPQPLQPLQQQQQQP